MKQRHFLRALAIVLVAGALFTVAAVAASDGETLISRSYLYDTFLPRVRSALRGEDGNGGDDAYAAAPGTKLWELSAGEGLSLRQGQVAVLLEGKARVTVDGTIINASMGVEAGSGYLNRNQRYLLCENTTAVLRAEEDSVLAVSAGADVLEAVPTPTPTPGTGANPFTDITSADWFYTDVLAAYERGLINGMTASTYAPNGTLTAGQCVKLAACMNQLWYEGEVTLENSTDGPWYRSYVDYALANGILTQEYANYDAIIVRQQFVQVFYNALPGSCYTPINDIPDNAIPDVKDDDVNAYEIYVFYRAGILTGYGDGSFGSGAINRAEVATIMNRMMDEGARKSFTLG